MARYPPYMAIDAELGMLVTEIDANLSHAETITHGLTDAQFNWRPGAGRWSIAECVSHLVIVDGGDIAPLRSAIDKGRAQNRTGEGPYEYGFLAKKFVSSMDLPVKKKFKAPKYYVPPPESGLEKTMAEYRRVAGEIRALAISAKLSCWWKQGSLPLKRFTSLRRTERNIWES